MAAALARAGRRPGAWGRPPLEGLPELREWFARGIGGAVTAAEGADRGGRPGRAGHRPARARPARRPRARGVAHLPGHAGPRPRGRPAARPGARGPRRGTARPARGRLPRHRRPGLRLPAAVPEPDRRRAGPRPACRGAAHRPGGRRVRRRGRLRAPARARRRRPAAPPAGRRRPGRRGRPRRLADQGHLAQLPGQRPGRARTGAGTPARHPGRGQLLRPPPAPGGRPWNSSAPRPGPAICGRCRPS